MKSTARKLREPAQEPQQEGALTSHCLPNTPGNTCSCLKQSSKVRGTKWLLKHCSKQYYHLCCTDRKLTCVLPNRLQANKPAACHRASSQAGGSSGGSCRYTLSDSTLSRGLILLQPPPLSPCVELTCSDCVTALTTARVDARSQGHMLLRAWPVTNCATKTKQKLVKGGKLLQRHR